MTKIPFISSVTGAILIVIFLFWMNRQDSTNGEVRGIVLLGPICPVERIPPDPNCAPKPYQVSIDIYQIRGGYPLKRIETESDGTFSVTLAPGEYEFRPAGETPFPICDRESVRVDSGLTSEIKLLCDTGIR
ncbi:MAG: hypothetical protein AAB518_03110 [Patescibacteria group bacterium]